MADYWFKPHDYGYGATPISWKGWAAVAVYAAVMVALALSLATLARGHARGTRRVAGDDRADHGWCSDVRLPSALPREDRRGVEMALGQAALIARHRQMVPGVKNGGRGKRS